MHIRRNFGLDLIRFFAVIFVLIAHTLRIIFQNNVSLFVVDFCAVWGVELFFVLSGYLIGSILIKTFTDFQVNLQTCKQFWIRRWFRTLPNYYLMLFVYLLFSVVVDHFFPLSKVELFKNLFFVQRIRPILHQYSFFPASWSLGVEEWFYLTFPILVIGFYKALKSVRKSVIYSILFVVVLCLSLRIIGTEYYNWAWDEGYRKTLPLRIDAICIGVLAAYIKIYSSNIWSKKNLLLVVGMLSQIVLVIIFKLQFFDNYDKLNDIQVRPVGGFMNTWFFTMNSLSLICFLPFISTLKFNSKVITTVSLISYSIYLNHGLIIMINNKIEWTLPLLKFLSIWVEVLIISYVQYHFFEVKMTKLRNVFSGSHNSIVKSFV